MDQNMPLCKITKNETRYQKKNQKKNKIKLVITNLTIITLNVNELNSPIKKKTQSDQKDNR